MAPEVCTPAYQAIHHAAHATPPKSAMVARPLSSFIPAWGMTHGDPISYATTTAICPSTA